jgi:FtsH-binding integral membrane protein
MGFVRKVFGIVATQMMVTSGVVALFYATPTIPAFFFNNPGVIYAVIALYCAFACALSCFPSLARSYPTNYFLLGAFTVCTSILVAFITAVYDPATVLAAAGITTGVCIGLFAFAFQTRYDFTKLAPYFFVFFLVTSLALLVFSLATIHNTSTGNKVWATFGILLFSFYIVFDVQMIVGGKHHKYQFSVDDYVFAAFMLYLDIINLFLKVLQLLGNK